ncbi:putative MFS family arabinose efflux permease [Pusillimonas noertemannii]|uniref:Putative MFS family arabinose efflux permease n=2 Tax=Pusillimonas noertemannii TaxID=305977 RepID=A0A2U1CP61_9BURK|nr:MFS transporter [Pusillimonas noertemannii]PVY67680.1 putative MFS family arabinose efflux permease [Pusillimonas noertemannii]TFL12782.1 MFS transporter [Pusillimonas noertemannii]
MSSNPLSSGTMQPAKLKLTPTERRASLMLSLLFASRMLGLFLLTPIFAVAALSVPGGDDAAKVGIALGAYGLTQAFLQIPLGMASDRYGRRAVIVFGMLLFTAGGIMCALASDINWIIAGRVVQGLGAVSAAITAWIADATRPEVRTRAMAMVGGSIGISFAASLVLSPLLVGEFGLSGLFWAISLLGFVCLFIAVALVPSAPRVEKPIVQARPRDVLRHAGLLRLNFGVFCLHFILMALFMVAPGLLSRLGGYDSAHLWEVYLPVILLSFILMVPAVFYTETRRVHKVALEVAVAGLAVVLALMPLASHNFYTLVVLLVGFFIAFNILEALQPSLVSRVAPVEYKGLALGFYNTAQSLGVFAGATLGGVISAQGDTSKVFLLAAALAFVWFLTARGFRSGPSGQEAGG